MIFPPCVTLGTILCRMPRWYDDHVMVAIKSAYVYGYANPLWSRSAPAIYLNSNQSTP